MAHNGVYGWLSLQFPPGGATRWRAAALGDAAPALNVYDSDLLDELDGDATTVDALLTWLATAPDTWATITTDGDRVEVLAYFLDFDPFSVAGTPLARAAALAATAGASGMGAFVPDRGQQDAELYTMRIADGVIRARLTDPQNYPDQLEPDDLDPVLARIDAAVEGAG